MNEQTPDRQRVLDACAQVYRPEGVVIWMRSPNQLLGNESPDALIERGETDRVLALIEGLAEGVIL